MTARGMALSAVAKHGRMGAAYGSMREMARASRGGGGGGMPAMPGAAYGGSRPGRMKALKGYARQGDGRS